MIEEHYIDLMNNEIDGHNTPVQSETLRSYLESNQEAQRFFWELKKSIRLLAESEEVENPADMPQRIMDLIAKSDARKSAPERYPAAEARPGTADRARRSIFGSFLQPTPAWAFAAGLVLGIFAFNAIDLLWRTSPSPDLLRGDLGILFRSSEELRGSPWSVGGAGFVGNITVHQFEGHLLVRFDGSAGPDTRFILAYDGELSSVAYHYISGSTATLRTTSGRTTLAFAGAGAHVVELLGGDLAPLSLILHIESAGERLERVFGPVPP